VFQTRRQHPYWVWESMMRTPEMLQSCLEQPVRGHVERVADRVAELAPRRVFCAGTGSSCYASIVHAHAFEQVAGLPASWYVTSDLDAYPPIGLAPGSVLIVTSHSGRTMGDLPVVELARRRGAYTVGITDIDSSPLAQAVDDTIIGPGGSKAELPATRTYSAAVFRVLQLAAALAQRLQTPETGTMYESRLRELPGILGSFLDSFAHQAQSCVDRLCNVEHYFVIGAGPNMGTALEGALILLQSTDAGAQAFHPEEMLHGPIQALTTAMCVVAVAAPGPFQERILQTAEASRTIGATVLSIAPEGSPGLDADLSIPMPADIPELLTPLLYIVPFWLLGYQFALTTGRDPDLLSMGKERFQKAFRRLMAGDSHYDRQSTPS